MNEGPVKNRVIVIGGGFGGLEAALSLKRLLGSEAGVTIVEKSDHQSFLPSIHEVVSGKIGSEKIEIPLEPILRASGVVYVQGEVLSVDLEHRQVITSEQVMEYDYLILACGAINSFYGVPGAKEFAHTFRSPRQAQRIADDLNRVLADSVRPCKIMILGGGLEGVEVAGEVLDRIKAGGYGGEFESDHVSLNLIQAKERLLFECPERAHDFASKYLTDKGVKIHRGVRIVNVEKHKITLDSGEQMETSLLIWTGGIEPAQLIRALPLPKDSHGWIGVTERLHSPEDERVYGIGDTATILSDQGALPLQRVAHHALDQARVAALNIYLDIQGRRKVRYYPKMGPQLISLGRDMGMFVQDNLFRTGRWVVGLKKIVEKRHIASYRHRPCFIPFSSKLPGSRARHIFRMLMPI